MIRLMFILLSIGLLGFLAATPHMKSRSGEVVATQTSTQSATSASPILALTGVTYPVHDPTMIKAGATYYIVSSGLGIPIHCSTDMVKWDICGKIFRVGPTWVYKAIPGVTDLWAPDLVEWGGQYHLYYAASTFGSNQSAIGLATNVTMDDNDPNYRWVDEGAVITSQKTDDFNAIDPNLVTDQAGQRWLVFGSFWTGIKMRKIDSVTGKLATDDSQTYALASRPGNTAIEGGYITYHDGFYYLFVSFDFCCKGVDSTYKIMVGRAAKISGPYVDRDANPMLEGGGSLVYAGSDRWRGPGHNSIYIENGTYWMVYHAYDANTNGVPTLHIEALAWDEQGWPVAPSSLIDASAP